MILKPSVKLILLPIITLALLLACKSAPESNNTVKTETGILKVFVDDQGTVTVNGNVKSIEAFEAALDKLGEDGMIYYSRENSAGDPHPNAMKIIGLIINKGLPIQFYTDGTFTTQADI